MNTLSLQEKLHIVQDVEQYVQKLLSHEKAAHDFYHINRVRKTALAIAKQEGADFFIVELAALLHEVGDHKIVGKGNEKKSLMNLQKFLSAQNIPQETIEEIMYIINNQSYSKSGISGETLDSLAGRCVQDADRLEALGAIGIARCFAFNGMRGKSIHEEAIGIPLSVKTINDYINATGHTAINHFYEKLLKLKDLMNTKAGKKLAKHRHEFMEHFLEEFFAEWNGTR